MSQPGLTQALPTRADSLLEIEITPELVEKHGLSSEEYQKIVSILGREPNITELGIFSVMWSEHCSYKSSKPLLRLMPTEKVDKNAPGQMLIKAGEENAGVVDIGDGWAISFKIESHNHPSAIEPFEGAATGVGGIIRDIFTMGARPVLLTNSLRFGDLASPQVKRLFRGVVHGIAHYGNCIGIPNIGGDVYFDSCYEGNPLVNGLCLGVVRHERIMRGAATGIGNPVYYVGPPTGRDGLGGASFASRDLTEESSRDRPAVQKGDPFMEKLLLEACLEMMAVPGLVVGIQDMGAAGLTCSSCETAGRGDTGIEIELDLVPQRETGMNSYEIMLSESQERMLVIAQKGREDELEEIFAKWDLPAVKIGSVTEGADMVVKHGGTTVARIPAKALADDGPVYEREAREPSSLEITRAWDPSSLPDLDYDGINAVLPKLLSHPTIAGKRWVWSQYDHMVQAGTVVLPGSDAGVVRLRLDDGAEKFLAIANDCNNRYCSLNPRRGGAIAVVECLRNLACSGARPLALTNCLNFGNPLDPEVFYMFRECVLGLTDVCKFFDLPVSGGNVSFYNQNQNGPIDPTPVISVAGIIDEKRMITTQTLKSGREILLLLGGYPDEIGAGYYLQVIHGLKTGDAPNLDLEAEKRLHQFMLEQIREGRVAAAHDLAEGGLLVAMAEMLFSTDNTRGATLEMDFSQIAGRLDAMLFGESQGRVILAVHPDTENSVLDAAAAAGVPALKIGQASEEPLLKISYSDTENPIEWDARELRRTWEESIPEAMKLI